MFELLNDMRGQILFMSYEGNQTPLTSEGESLESSVSVICDIFVVWDIPWPSGFSSGKTIGPGAEVMEVKLPFREEAWSSILPETETCLWLKKQSGQDYITECQQKAYQPTETADEMLVILRMHYNIQFLNFKVKYVHNRVSTIILSQEYFQISDF